MSENNIFRDTNQEVLHLLKELSEMKTVLKETSQKISQIERHVKRAFQIPSKPKEKNKQLTAKGNAEPTIDGSQALKIFDELSDSWIGEKTDEIKNSLSEMLTPDLKLMAHELGLTFKSKPSKNSLCSSIMGRLNERYMMSKNINVTKPKSEDQ